MSHPDTKPLGKVDEIPVIILTGDTRESRDDEALSKGARLLIRKPFTPESIVSSLDQVLPTARRASARCCT